MGYVAHSLIQDEEGGNRGVGMFPGPAGEGRGGPLQGRVLTRLRLSGSWGPGAGAPGTVGGVCGTYGSAPLSPVSHGHHLSLFTGSKAAGLG